MTQHENRKATASSERKPGAGQQVDGGAARLLSNLLGERRSWAECSGRSDKSGRNRSRMNQTVIDHFRCPRQFLETSQPDSRVLVKFAHDARHSRVNFPTFPTGRNVDTEKWWGDTNVGAQRIRSDSDLARIVEDLRQERYVDTSRTSRNLFDVPLFRRAYYAIRPLLPAAVRRGLQSFYFAGFGTIPFPRWPVDCTVDELLEKALAVAIKRSGVNHIPFIWFWPDAHSGCVIVTHDVETRAGLDFCPQLMNLDDAADIKSAFEIVPRGRYPVQQGLLQEIRDRGFEINVHDFNHDGLLYTNRETFQQRAREINLAAHEFGASGFRSGGLYRKQEWYADFEFSYDMSVPNCGHLEAQRGGCCTVMPYFIGNILELPLTTVQDYPLFSLLGDFSLTVWKAQVELILKKHGLISFLTHPDYVREPRALASYRSLLRYIRVLASDRGLWLARPGEVDQWWRNRSQMTLLPEANGWRIDGPGSERAQIAYATLEGEQLTYEICDKCLVP